MAFAVAVLKPMSTAVRTKKVAFRKSAQHNEIKRNELPFFDGTEPKGSTNDLRRPEKTIRRVCLFRIGTRHSSAAPPGSGNGLHFVPMDSTELLRLGSRQEGEYFTDEFDTISDEGGGTGRRKPSAQVCQH